MEHHLYWCTCCHLQRAETFPSSSGSFHIVVMLLLFRIKILSIRFTTFAPLSVDQLVISRFFDSACARFKINPLGRPIHNSVRGPQLRSPGESLRRILATPDEGQLGRRGVSSWVFPPSIDPPIDPSCLIKLPLACGLQITTALHEPSVKMHTNPYLVVSMFGHVQPVDPFWEHWMLLIRWHLGSLLELSLPPRAGRFRS